MSLRRLLLTAGLLFLLMLEGATPVRADIINLTASSGRTLNAEYRAGAPNRPAVIVLHGFLQTHEFLATRMIIDGLGDTGLAVLGPNFSLGIPNRKQSLQCEAAHKHTLAEDLAEIDLWVRWLLQRGYSSIILVGHSWGSQHALAYAESAHRQPVAGVIATSLVISQVPRKVTDAQVRRARTQLGQRKESLHPFRLGYCQRYMATRESYLSYYDFGDPAYITGAIRALRDRGLPLYIVEGGADRLIAPSWLADLRGTGADVSVIPGADHFFSSLPEFELIGRLEEILKQVGMTTSR